MSEDETYITIENVVASAILNQKFDLSTIIKVSPSVEYRPEQFPGLVYRLKKLHDEVKEIVKNWKID